jgi:hypothetical protein
LYLGAPSQLGIVSVLRADFFVGFCLVLRFISCLSAAAFFVFFLSGGCCCPAFVLYFVFSVRFVAQLFFRCVFVWFFLCVFLMSVEMLRCFAKSCGNNFF